MHIEFPSAAITIAPTRALAPAAWAVNQLLLAEVVGTPRENFSRLAIGDITVTARSEVPLEPGQKLALQVVATSPAIVLKVVAQPPARDAAAIDRALARQLPRQATAQEAALLARALDAAASAAPLRAGAPQVAHALARAVHTLPQPADLMTAERLRLLLTSAAIPLEAKCKAALASARPPALTGDVRAQLLHVQAQLEAAPRAAAEVGAALAALPARMPPAAQHTQLAPGAAAHAPAQHVPVPARAPPPPAVAEPAPDAAPAAETVRLERLVEGVSARLHANQLQNVALPNAPASPLVIEIPLFHHAQGAFLRFEIEDEHGAPREDQAGGARTHVRINLAFDDGCDFAARLRLSGDTLSVRLGSSDGDYHAALAAHIDDLQRQFERQGIVNARCVVAPLEAAAERPSATRQLVDDEV